MCGTAEGKAVEEDDDYRTSNTRSSIVVVGRGGVFKGQRREIPGIMYGAHPCSMVLFVLLLSRALPRKLMRPSLHVYLSVQFLSRRLKKLLLHRQLTRCQVAPPYLYMFSWPHIEPDKSSLGCGTSSTNAHVHQCGTTTLCGHIKEYEFRHRDKERHGRCGGCGRWT